MYKHCKRERKVELHSCAAALISRAIEQFVYLEVIAAQEPRPLVEEAVKAKLVLYPSPQARVIALYAVVVARVEVLYYPKAGSQRPAAEL